MNFYLKYSKEKIKLADKPFAGGGEGNLYKIVSPIEYKNYVAKLYHPIKLNDQRFEKIKFLYHNPVVSSNSENHPTFVWIKDILLSDQRDFVGFIMPFVKGEKLEVLSSQKLAKHLGKEWQRFDHSEASAFNLRIRLCFNLAIAVHALHATEKYVLVDLKPDNVIVQSNGLISLVDMDSVEVMENGLVIFPAPVSTPEFTAPEHYRSARENADDAIDIYWDLFSMSVIFYRLLFGIHPFAASAKAPYDNYVSLHDKIREGLFVHNPDLKEIFSVIPPPHRAFDNLNPEIKNLFIQTFSAGHFDPQLRPLASEWCMAFLEIFGDEAMKSHFKKILFYGAGSPLRIKKPSELRKLPPFSLKANDLISYDFDLILNWAAPDFNKLSKLISVKSPQKIGCIWPTIVSFLIFGIIYKLSLQLYPNFSFWHSYDLWQYSTISIVLYFLAALFIPFVVLPTLINFVYIKWFSDGNVKKFKKIIKEVQINTLKLLKLKEVLKILKNEAYLILEELELLFQAKIAELNSKLQEEDKIFDALLEEEQKMIEQEEILSLKNLFTDDYFKNYQNVSSFNELKRKILLEKENMINLIKDNPIEINTQQKINADALKKNRQKELEKIKEQQLSKIKEMYSRISAQKKEDENNLMKAYRKEAGIHSNYRKYFGSLSTNIKELSAVLIKKGLNSINQIDSINHIKLVVYLNNGNQIDLKEITSAKAYNLAGALEDWMIALSKLDLKIKEEQDKINKNYTNKYNSLKKEENEVAQNYSEELKDFDVELQEHYYNIQKLNIEKEYQQKLKKIEDVEKMYLISVKSILESNNESLAEIRERSFEFYKKFNLDLESAKKLKKENLLDFCKSKKLTAPLNQARDLFSKTESALNEFNKNLLP
jgi:hypothetical protein